MKQKTLWVWILIFVPLLMGVDSCDTEDIGPIKLFKIHFNPEDYLQAQLFVSRAEDGNEDIVDAVLRLENKTHHTLQCKGGFNTGFSFEDEHEFNIEPHGVSWVKGTVKQTDIENKHRPISSISIKVNLLQLMMVQNVPQKHIDNLTGNEYYMMYIPLEPYSPVETSFPKLKFLYYKTAPYSEAYYAWIGGVALVFWLLLLLLKFLWSLRFVRSSSVLMALICVLLSVFCVATFMSGANSIALLLEEPPNYISLSTILIGLFLLLFALDLISLSGNIIFDNFLVSVFLLALSVLTVTSVWSGKHLVVTSVGAVWPLAIVALATFFNIVVWLKVPPPRQRPKPKEEVAEEREKVEIPEDWLNTGRYEEY